MTNSPEWRSRPTMHRFHAVNKQGVRDRCGSERQRRPLTGNSTQGYTGIGIAESVDLDKMRAQLRDWPIEGLQEVIVIDSQGNVLRFYL